MSNEVSELLAKHLERWEAHQREVEQARTEASHTEVEEKQRKRAELVETQRQAGRCNITPMPSVATKPFRTELYTEALPVFVANTFRGKSRTWERTLSHPDSGEPVIDRVIVGRSFGDDTDHGVLRQTHQEVWYQLLKLWNDRSYPVVTNGTATYGFLEFSAYELVKTLRGSDGAEHYRRVRCLLKELSHVPICRQQHYQWRDELDQAEFTLLASVEWRGRALNPRTMIPFPHGRSEVIILLSRFVTERFLEHRVKPLLLQPYLALAGKGRGRSNQLAALLYPKLDRELATKDQFHKKLAPLFDELGLRPYRYKSQRKVKMGPALKALDGQPICNERYTLTVELADSADGDDFVLVARRSKQAVLNL